MERIYEYRARMIADENPQRTLFKNGYEIRRDESDPFLWRCFRKGAKTPFAEVTDYADAVGRVMIEADYQAVRTG